MKDLQATDGFALHAWMVTELGLKGPALVTYAIVHQFTQSEAGIYTGGIPYVAAWLGCSRESARKYLHELADAGLIRAIPGNLNGVPFCNYQVIDNHIPKNLGYIPKNFVGDTQNFRRGIPKNFGIEINKDINNNNKSLFTPPTPQEVSSYCSVRGWTDPDGFAKHFIDYYTQAGWHLSNGKPMKDWKKAVITWEPNNKFRNFAGAPTPRSAAPSPKRSREDQAFANMMELGKKLGFMKQETPAYDEQ